MTQLRANTIISTQPNYFNTPTSLASPRLELEALSTAVNQLKYLMNR